MSTPRRTDGARDDAGDAARQVASDPHDLAAERAVLGGVLLDPEKMQTLGNVLTVEDFFAHSHRCVFRAFLELDERREPIDALVTLRKLRELGLAEAAGGPSFLATLPALVPTSANIDHYARIVKQKRVLRDLLAFARETQHAAQGEVEDVGRLVDETAQRAMALSTGGTATSIVPLSKALGEALNQAEKLSKLAQTGVRDVVGVPSGFHALDRITSGWQPGDLIILAARPGMGKTAFALNLLINAAKDRRRQTPGAIFSLEMSKEQLATRVWCAESMVPMESVRSGDLPAQRWDKLYNGFTTLHKLPVFIDDTAAIPVAEMMRKCRQLKHEHGVGLVVVDYLQLMTASQLSRSATREQQISDISRSLKQLAKEIQAPVIALSQLNRGVESRTDKRPLLSDLRESGAIEQDADLILFLYRDDYYQQMKGGDGGDEAPRQPGAASPTELIIAKHRSGSTGKVEIQFHASYTLFSNMPQDAAPPRETQLG